MRPLRHRSIALAATAAVLGGGGMALAAFQDLPPGSRVDDDPAAGIDSAGRLAGSPDVVGGALVAGAPRVPWTAFAHAPSEARSQVVVRAFKNGRWTTQGKGTVGGLPGGTAWTLNFDPAGAASGPAIDFAGPGRTVPWATWSEVSSAGDLATSAAQVFVSRFSPPTAATNPDKWVITGTNRAADGEPALPPSLNLHADRSAFAPAIAGGSTTNPQAPGPWVAWSEQGAAAPGLGLKQIYVARPASVPPQQNATPTCPEDFRLGDTTGGVPVGNFCFGQVGIGRVGTDPSLNVDRTRDGVDADIAFTGPNDSVPWVVWRETGPTLTDGLHDNAMVFAARGVADATADGDLKWEVVGLGARGLLDNSDTGGSCTNSFAAETACSLNVASGKDAGAPRVAAGTMTPGGIAAPWVVWEEADPADEKADHKIFVARLTGVGTETGPRFTVANGGREIARGTSPDISFSGHTPHVSWNRNGHAQTGHFTSVDAFVKDTTAPGLGTAVPADVRPSLSSGCTADPFTTDGSACPGGALGTPFVLFGDRSGEALTLRASAYRAAAPTGETASGVTTSEAVLSASVDPQGARVRAQFEYGLTTQYGSTTPVRTLGADGAQTLDEAIEGLPAGTVVHYRAVATSDFGTVTGDDHAFTTATPATEAPPNGGGVTPPAPGGGPVTPPALRAPLLRVTSHLARTGRRRVNVTVGVDRASTVRVTATLRGKVRGATRSLRLGRVTARYLTGGRKVLRVVLSTRAQRALRTWRATRIGVAVTATPASGPAAARTQTLVLKRR